MPRNAFNDEIRDFTMNPLNKEGAKFDPRVFQFNRMPDPASRQAFINQMTPEDAVQFSKNAHEAVARGWIPLIKNASLTLSNNDRDAAIRTVIGEAGNQPPNGQAAVANVMLNRLTSGKFGKTMTDVAFAPGQFDSWRQQGPALTGINPNSWQYQNVGKIVDGVVSGATARTQQVGRHIFSIRHWSKTSRNGRKATACKSAIIRSIRQISL